MSSPRLTSWMVVLLALVLCPAHAHPPNLDANAPGGIGIRLSYFAVEPTTGTEVEVTKKQIELNGGEKLNLRVQVTILHKPQECTDRNTRMDEEGTREIWATLTRRVKSASGGWIDETLGSEAECGSWSCASQTGGSAKCEFELACTEGLNTVINRRATDEKKQEFKPVARLGYCINRPNSQLRCNWQAAELEHTGDKLTLACKKK